MADFYTRAQFEEAAGYISSRSHHQPQVGLILGSGLNPLANAVEAADIIPYGDIPHFPRPTVEGHIGNLLLGRLAGAQVLVMQGRVHFYLLNYY